LTQTITPPVANVQFFDVQNKICAASKATTAAGDNALYVYGADVQIKPSAKRTLLML
jgi:hypothetical protein